MAFLALRPVSLLALPAMKLVSPLACLLALAFLGEGARSDEGTQALKDSFARDVKPFLKQHCERCHNPDKLTSGIRVDHLDAGLEDRQIKLWEAVRHQIEIDAMPPGEEPQPTKAERDRMLAWVGRGIEVARSRPAPKNGSVRRLTVAQYRNTLRELLSLDDELTETLPPDAVSRDGFTNNQETLALSPLLVEAYFDIAETALKRCLVDPKSKPSIQNFRVDLGAKINKEPCPDRLILGADSLLLNNEDFVVTQLNAEKPFAFEPFFMQTKYRFIEGYQGNDTVRGWREYDSIYHSVFACMRGTHGYPKGRAYGTVPEGLLLRPAIPSAEIFGLESTYGPRANFKISLRELPDDGRFRVTVTAAKYNDGLLLDGGAKSAEASDAGPSIVLRGFDKSATATATIAKAGIYEVDAFLVEPELKPPVVDGSRLAEGLIGAWKLDGDAKAATTDAAKERETVRDGKLQGEAAFVESPFGKAVSLDGKDDAIVVPHHESLHVGTGDFTVAAWIRPKELRQAGIVSLGKYGWTHGWYLDMPNNQGVLRIETSSAKNAANGTVQSPAGAIRANVWQHVAAVVRRPKGETQLFVNGYPVAKGTIAPEDLDNPKVDLYLGRIQDANQFQGEIDEVRIYRRALGEPELQALIEPGRQFVPPPPREKPQELTLTIGERPFIATLNQPAFVALRLDAGALPVVAQYAGATKLDRVVLTPLAEESELAKRFAIFERRLPKLGVHLGLRRDCGSTLGQVGAAQTVAATAPTRFVFEGAIRNFPSPDVEKDNVNYLAGVREIGVRSEFTDGRDMPRLLIRSVEFEGPYYDVWPPATHRNIFLDRDANENDAGYARRVIERFATRAFRRPATADETASLVGTYEKARASGSSFEESVKDALQTVLTSPQFLFLTENSVTPAAEPLDDHELASKLSYFLWNGPPDAVLLDLATRGKLRDALDEQVVRMIADPRFERFTSEFATQWLALDKFAVLEPDRGRFPRLTRDARTQLQREPVQYFQHLVRQNLPARQLIASEFVLANEATASYYDLADRTESGFDFVAIPHGRRELGGVLSQAALMAGLSDGRESNPVKRGAWLARRIIAEPPDDPPPNVPTVKEDPTLSLRQRLEQHRNQPGCAQCHSKIDPWGIPLEEFDAGGRLKSKPADAASTLPDKSEVAGFEGLRKYLAEDRIDQVAFSLLKHLTTYATGRTLTYNELALLKLDGMKLKTNGYRMQDLLQYVVRSPMFGEK